MLHPTNAHPEHAPRGLNVRMAMLRRVDSRAAHPGALDLVYSRLDEDLADR